ncbi:hypothetical protein FB451DRAFT_1372027 [Mycena latifolia]|nr:hypothetical protein FB451DRAFT_1372027 [Mycena latifolia]
MAPQFSFAPNSSYLLSGSGMAWTEKTLPTGVLRFLEDRNDPLAVGTPYDVAFPMEPDSFFMSWKATDGKDWFERSTLGPNYARLSAFVKSVSTEGTHTSSTVFGPGASYFSRSPSGFSWQNLPPELEDEIQNTLLKRRPTTVALGVDKSYVALYDDGSLSLELRGQYPLVEALLNDTAERSRRRDIAYIALNPFVAGEYYVVYGDGSARWNLPPAWEADVSSISHEIAPSVRASPGGTRPASAEHKHHIDWEEVNQKLEATVHIAEFINIFQN